MVCFFLPKIFLPDTDYLVKRLKLSITINNCIAMRITFCLFFLISFASAQTTQHNTQKGVWKVSGYSKNIIKLSFTPKGYNRNEQITDAVILKPSTQQAIPVHFADSVAYISYKNNKVAISFFENASAKGFCFALDSVEKIFGGGSRALPLNRRGHRFPLDNNAWYGYSDGADHLNFSVPFFTSSKGYGLFFDNGSRGYVDIGKKQPGFLEAAFESGEINVFVIFGDNYSQILSGFHALTGKQPLPPRWAMGNLMSRFGYTSQKQLDGILQITKNENVPLDAAIFDLFWFGDSIKGTLGNLDWVNREKWPNPSAMMKKYAQSNIHSVLITEPFFLKGTQKYEAAGPFLATDSFKHPFMLTDFYFGVGGLLDIFKKSAGDWIWNIHYKKQIVNGAGGWWTDLGEPEKHPAGLMHDLSSRGFKRMFGANEVHNVYGHYWNKMLFEHYQSDLPGKRLFHLNRSGFAGSQRYSIFPWSGDVSRSWEGLRAQLPLIQGMSMSGIPYIHSDAGGFAGGSGDNELYVRWLQFAAFTPIFRPHGTALDGTDPNAFSFPSEPALIKTPFKEYAKSVVTLRYSLLPYNYTLTYNQAKLGAPLIAPLYYYFPTDTLLSSIYDEYMWGENLLVAPIVQKNQVARQVYFPKGGWYALPMDLTFIHHPAKYSGTQTINAAIQQIPFFAKAGSFIPVANKKNISNTEDVRLDTLMVHYFYDTTASIGFIYNDDGIGAENIQNENYELMNFKADPLMGDGLKVVIAKKRGKAFKSIGTSFLRLQLHGLPSEDKKLYINGVAAAESNQLNWKLNQLIELKMTNQKIFIELK